MNYIQQDNVKGWPFISIEHISMVNTEEDRLYHKPEPFMVYRIVIKLVDKDQPIRWCYRSKKARDKVFKEILSRR